MSRSRISHGFERVKLSPGNPCYCRASGRSDGNGLGDVCFGRLWRTQYDIELEDLAAAALVDADADLTQIDELVLGDHLQQLLLQLRQVVRRIPRDRALTRDDDLQAVLGDGSALLLALEVVEETHSSPLLFQPKMRFKKPRFSFSMKRCGRSSPRKR